MALNHLTLSLQFARGDETGGMRERAVMGEDAWRVGDRAQSLTRGAEVGGVEIEEDKGTG
jgi:hypothetical protein